MTRLRPLFLAAVTSTVLAFNPGFAGELPKPVTDDDYRTYSQGQRKLGQLLFYDRILSGTYRVSCATCHSPDRASSNGFLTDPPSGEDGEDGEEGDALAINGLPLYDALKPSAKHAPALFNVGAKQFVTLFGDGRVARGDAGQFISPAGDELPQALSDVLAVQSLFPTVTGDELIGTVDNDIKSAAADGKTAVWQALVKRIQDLPDYLPFFYAAYPALKNQDEITIAQIANALAAFVATEWRSDKTPFDAYLRGDDTALTAQQRRGMDVFYGKAGCSLCHSGPFQTDHRFYNVANPLWRLDADLSNDLTGLHRDRADFTGQPRDQYRRRTPSLRNVSATAPYGHAGSFATLDGFLRHHLDPVSGLNRMTAELSRENAIADSVSVAVEAMIKTVELVPVVLSATEFDDLRSFLDGLTEEESLSGSLGRPKEVPSFLALD